MRNSLTTFQYRKCKYTLEKTRSLDAVGETDDASSFVRHMFKTPSINVQAETVGRSWNRGLWHTNAYLAWSREKA